jgi:hypothetical protein
MHPPATRPMPVHHHLRRIPPSPHRPRWRPHWPRIAAIVFIFVFAFIFYGLIGWGIAALLGGKP